MKTYSMIFLGWCNHLNFTIYTLYNLLFYVLRSVSKDNMLVISTTATQPLLVRLHIVLQIVINAPLLRAGGFSLRPSVCSPHRHKWYLFRSGLTEGQVSTIWTSTSGDGAKKQPTSAQMGKGSLAFLL